MLVVIARAACRCKGAAKIRRTSLRQAACWNPLTWKENPRAIMWIRSLANGVRGWPDAPFASATAAEVLPADSESMDMLTKLRVVPDSVEEFTGFYKGMDLLAAIFWATVRNHFCAKNQAVVRNVRLPTAYTHRSIPDSKHC